VALGYAGADLQDAVVPKKCPGTVNDGFVTFCTLDGGRIGIAALALGLAEGALDECLTYTSTRKQFGRPSRASRRHFRLADMATEIKLPNARLSRRLAEAERSSRSEGSRDGQCTPQSSAGDDEAVQLHRLAMRPNTIERMMQDARSARSVRERARFSGS
jgi:butyryl-CoA dehydrogenase